MGIAATFEELMEVLPDGEQFVGTRGGGMDHAASLASRAGCASLIEFHPLAVRHVPIPADWAFLVAHSLTVAEKSGAVREQYNACRAGGAAALEQLGLKSYVGQAPSLRRPRRPPVLSAAEQDAFAHVTSEAQRVQDAVAAMSVAMRPLSARCCKPPTPACATACTSAVPLSTAWWRQPWLPALWARASRAPASAAAP